MLSSRACRLALGEAFYDAVAATARRVSRDAFLTGVIASMERPAHRTTLDEWSLHNPMMSESPVIRPRSANSMQHTFTNLAVHIRVRLPRRFSELAVFYARLYIRVRRIDEAA